MKKKTGLTLSYAGIQGFYTMMYAGIGSFLSVFLLANGFSNAEIGLVISGANLFTVLFQPVIADAADRSKKFSLTSFILVIATVTSGFTFLMYFLHGHTTALFFCCMAALACHGFLQPLVNAVNFRMEEAGIHLDFGVCRAAGSVMFAIATSLLGTLVEKFGVLSIPSETLASFGFLVISIYMLSKNMKMTGGKEKQKEKYEEISLKDFIRHNKMFVIMNLGVVFVFFHSYILGTFMLQIITPLGGDAADMGRLFSLAAVMEVPAMTCYGRINRKLSSSQILKISMGGFVLKNVLLVLANNLTMVYIAQATQILGYGLFYPAMVSFIGEKMRHGEAVKGQSLFTIMMTVSGMIANVSGGILLDGLGVSVLVMFCFVTAAVGAGIIVFTCDRVPSHQERKSADTEVQVRRETVQQGC